VGGSVTFGSLTRQFAKYQEWGEFAASVGYPKAEKVSDSGASAPDQGSFREGTRGSAVLIVEKLPERMGTAFPLLKCLRPHYGHHCEPFSALKCISMQGFAYTISIFYRGNTPDLGRNIPRCLDPDTNFRLARQGPIVPVLRNDH